MKITIMIIVFTFAFITPSNGQCNVKTTVKPDGNVIKYFNPKPVIILPDYEVGISIYKNMTTDEFMLNISVLFKSMKPQKLNDDMIIQTTNINGIKLSPVVSELVKMNGREVAIGLYRIESADYLEFNKYALKSIFFYLNGNLTGSTVTENSTILKSELNCLKK